MLNIAARRSAITRARDLASRTIRVSDDAASLAAEFELAGLFAPVEEGGLGPDDFASIGLGVMGGDNSGLTREDLIGFFAVMGAILGPLTNEQKAAIYRVRSAVGPSQPGLV